MSYTKGIYTYISKPYDVVNYDSRKLDGTSAKITIGKFCSIGQNCTFIMANHLMDRVSTFPISVIYNDKHLFQHRQGNPNSFVRGDIVIGHDVWIGANVIIMDNVKISNGAVIAAGSVVTKDIPPYAIVGGNPAQIIKYRFSNEIIARFEAAKFWELPESEILNFNIWSPDIEEFLTEVEKLNTIRSSNP